MTDWVAIRILQKSPSRWGLFLRGTDPFLRHISRSVLFSWGHLFSSFFSSFQNDSLLFFLPQPPVNRHLWPFSWVLTSGLFLSLFLSLFPPHVTSFFFILFFSCGSFSHGCPDAVSNLGHLDEDACGIEIRQRGEGATSTVSIVGGTFTSNLKEIYFLLLCILQISEPDCGSELYI